MQNRTGRRFVFLSGSERETAELGESLGKRIDAGACIAIVGVLGAGKTVLVRGICRGLGVAEEILSPTFVLYEEFSGRLPVAHVDFYRLEHEREIEELGVFDKLGTDCVVLAEWGDRSRSVLDSSGVVIRLACSGRESRTLEIECAPEFEGWFDGLAAEHNGTG
jgi:tRNA threonylcarbamoyladenosine biosynthesis protein TsaE